MEETIGGRVNINTSMLRICWVQVLAFLGRRIGFHVFGDGHTVSQYCTAPFVVYKNLTAGIVNILKRVAILSS